MDFKKMDNESSDEYIYRICNHKEEIGNWVEVAKIINQQLGTNYGESAFRKKYQYYEKLFGAVGSKQIQNGQIVDNMIALKEDIIKEKVKLSDRKREYNKTLRDESRIEDLKLALSNYVRYLPKLVFDSPVKKEKPKENEAILMFSDLHIGSEFSHFYGSYNLEIAQKRCSKLVTDTIRYCQLNNVGVLRFANLGDMIHGLIHVNGRVDSEFGTIEQVKQAAEIISQMLVKLSPNFTKIYYYSCTDNHSRVFADKDEHIEKENFSKLIDWYVEERLRACRNIEFANENAIDDSFFTFETNNHKVVVGSHGHLGKTNTSVQDFTAALNRKVDIVLLGHFHNEKQKNFDGSKVYINGSVMGADEYAISKRLFSKPEQTLIILDHENDIKVSINL